MMTSRGRRGVILIREAYMQVYWTTELLEACYFLAQVCLFYSSPINLHEVFSMLLIATTAQRN